MKPETSLSPDWAKKRIGYQCFVDSFAMGENSIADKASLYPKEVYRHPSRLLNWSEEFPEYCYGHAYYGGDLNGVTRSIDHYLTGFGIDLLYLTPIFKADSNHKYDTIDYKTIDPQFGDMQSFKRLVETCHRNGMKLILDGVFNHTSSRHEWFVKALNSEKRFDAYYKKNETGHYIKWAGVDSLPVLNHDHPDVQAYFYGSPDCIVRYWLDQGADGWRLDVAERLGRDVIRNIKESMRSRYSDKILYGEVVETYGREWLGPDLLDGVMNYVFLGNTANFLTGRISGLEYLFELNKMFEEYPREQLYNSWNIISTHDTNRMIAEVDGNENLFKMAVALQFTYPGIPMIYNGDELGILPGQKDRDNRRGMDWQRVDILKLKSREPWKTVQPMDWKKLNEYSSFHFFYKHLIWLKKNHPVLTGGDFIPAFADEDVVSYFRVLDDRAALVIVNRGNAKNITIRIPDRVHRLKSVLKGAHGPLREVDLNGESLKISVYNQNSYLFVN